MPAINTSYATSADVLPESGQSVIASPFSGPLGSPFDNDQDGNESTGALNTGIGFGGNKVYSAIADTGVLDSYIVGVTKPDNTAATTAILIAIGGGHSDATDDGEAVTTPYDDIALLSFGRGIERDAGDPGVAPHTGHSTKLVTASGSVANGAAIEANFLNMSGITMASGQSAFGSATADTAAIAPDFLVPTITGDTTPAVTVPDLPVETYTADPADSTWSIVGGADEALFEIDAATGALAFIDASIAGEYTVWVQATEPYQGAKNKVLVYVTVSA